MADKWQAQQEFWESFGLPAYDDQSEFTEGELPAYPHITYESFSGVMGQQVLLSASIWYRSFSMKEIKQKADEILKMITPGILIKIDEGFLWIKVPENTAFARPIASGAEDVSIKRIVLTVEAESLSAY